MPERAELTIVSVSFSKTPIYVGDKFEIYVEVKNTGDTTVTTANRAGPFDFSPEDLVEHIPYYGLFPVELQPGEGGYLGPERFRAVKAGTVSCTVSVYWNGNLEDMHISTMTFTFNIESAGPADLVVYKCWVSPSNPKQEDSVTFYAVIANIGGSDANNFRLETYLDGGLYDSGSLSLRAGEETQVWSEIPWRAEDGSHTVRWVINPDRSIEESDYGNNEASCSFFVSPRTVTATVTSTTTRIRTIVTSYTITSTTTGTRTFTTTYSFTVTTTGTRTVRTTETDTISTTSTRTQAQRTETTVILTRTFTKLSTTYTTVESIVTRPVTVRETQTVLITSTIYSPTITVTATTAQLASNRLLWLFLTVFAMVGAAFQLPKVHELRDFSAKAGRLFLFLLRSIRRHCRKILLGIALASVFVLSIISQAGQQVFASTVTTTRTVTLTTLQSTTLTTSRTVTSKEWITSSVTKARTVTSTDWKSSTMTTTRMITSTEWTTLTQTLTSTRYSYRDTTTTSVTTSIWPVYTTTRPTVTVTFVTGRTTTVYLPTTTTISVKPGQIIIGIDPVKLLSKNDILKVRVRNPDSTRATIAVEPVNVAEGWRVEDGEWWDLDNSKSITLDPGRVDSLSFSFKPYKSGPCWPGLWCDSPGQDVGDVRFRVTSTSGLSETKETTLWSLWVIAQTMREEAIMIKRFLEESDKSLGKLYDRNYPNPDLLDATQELIDFLDEKIQQSALIKMEPSLLFIPLSEFVGALNTGLTSARIIKTLLDKFVGGLIADFCGGAWRDEAANVIRSLKNELENYIRELGKDTPNPDTITASLRRQISSIDTLLNLLNEIRKSLSGLLCITMAPLQGEDTIKNIASFLNDKTVEINKLKSTLEGWKGVLEKHFGASSRSASLTPLDDVRCCPLVAGLVASSHATLGRKQRKIGEPRGSSGWFSYRQRPCQFQKRTTSPSVSFEHFFSVPI